MRYEVLPSTSPANAALRYEQKLLRWRTFWRTAALSNRCGGTQRQRPLGNLKLAPSPKGVTYEKDSAVPRQTQSTPEDNHALKPSFKRFKDGGQYRIEIPSVEGPRVFREVLQAAKAHKVPIHRVSQGSGVMLLARGEIREMAEIGHDEGIEVCLFVGPRATFETGAQTASTAGKIIGLQHRGADQLVYAIEDVRRACDLGIRSILPADLGLIWVLDAMKQKGELPKNLVIKSSVTLPAANPPPP